MIEAGQFLSKPGSVLGFLSGFGIVGIGLAMWTLMTLRSRYVDKLVPGLGAFGYLKGIGLAASISIGLTLVLQTLSLLLLSTTAHVASADTSQVAKMSGFQTIVRSAGPTVAKNVATAAQRSRGLAVVLMIISTVFVLLLVVGAGYAFTALDMSFLGHFAAFSAGVGLVEEFSKAIAGLAILYLIVPKGSNLTQKEFEWRVLGSFGIAGLGFGFGEALHYFEIYSQWGCGIDMYALRAIWCVTLHGAWTLIVGQLLLMFYPDLPKNCAEVEEVFANSAPQTANEVGKQEDEEVDKRDGEVSSTCPRCGWSYAWDGQHCGHCKPGSIKVNEASGPTGAEKVSGWAFMILLACLPSLLLHALYNTCCLHESDFMWVVGGGTILIAVAIIYANTEPSNVEAATRE
ncbi:hypothetical protein Pan216_03980 [Planctomycetes bacterium Pan216]|uniref:Uncharacterized protein n=1 Tax=Kolteria novifilia TaxID=2527975 RepID=A0A518AXW5_9BACT|nr:hypothetical protein Pan216_03980 [Planctomycetes bacterium Pan216]